MIANTELHDTSEEFSEGMSSFGVTEARRVAAGKGDSPFQWIASLSYHIDF